MKEVLDLKKNKGVGGKGNDAIIILLRNNYKTNKKRNAVLSRTWSRSDMPWVNPHISYWQLSQTLHSSDCQQILINFTETQKVMIKLKRI